MNDSPTPLSTNQNRLLHFRDPCVHCGLAMQDVASGPCLGDAKKAVPMFWRSVSVRWDHVEQFLIQMSDGELVERWAHVSMGPPYDYLNDATYRQSLRRVR